ncbi:MAG: SHOCT domain-containing protein [Syntrophales bacterium]
MKALFFSIAAVGLLSSCTRDCGYGFMGMGGPDGGWWPMMHGGFGGIFMWIIFIVLIGLLIYLLARGVKGGARTSESPVEILKKRYARGEITKEDFERMRKDIGE